MEEMAWALLGPRKVSERDLHASNLGRDTQGQDGRKGTSWATSLPCLSREQGVGPWGNLSSGSHFHHCKMEMMIFHRVVTKFKVGSQQKMALGRRAH